METQTQDVRIKDRNSQAVDVLRRLNDLGAINLDLMISKADEIKAITKGGGAGSVAAELEPGDICYPFYVRVGPRIDVDIVSVASELKALGFEIKRMAFQK